MSSIIHSDPSTVGPEGLSVTCTRPHIRWLHVSTSSGSSFRADTDLRIPVVELSRTEFIGRNDFAAGHGGEQRSLDAGTRAFGAGPKYAVVQAAVSMRSVRPQRTNIWTL